MFGSTSIHVILLTGVSLVQTDLADFVSIQAIEVGASMCYLVLCHFRCTDRVGSPSWSQQRVGGDVSIAARVDRR